MNCLVIPGGYSLLEWALEEWVKGCGGREEELLLASLRQPTHNYRKPDPTA